MELELGYYFYPPDYLDKLGPSQLVVNLYQEPTRRHFDPERAVFPVVETGGTVKHTTLIHPWQGGEHFQVCTGRIIIIDRREKVVEAFSLGGNLRITTHPDHTHCVLTSTTPIAELLNSQSIIGLVVAEFEALLAQKQAEWKHDEAGFRKQLATIDSYTLFVAGLIAVQEKLDCLPLTESHQKTCHALHEAIRILQREGRWPATLPVLDDLL